jgi:hypothetical protein
MKPWIVLGVLFAFIAVCTIGCETPQMTPEERERAQLLGAEVKTLEGELQAVIAEIKKEGVTPEKLLSLRTEAKIIYDRLRTIQAAIEKITADVKARAPDTWSKIGSVLLNIFWGAVGYWTVGRPGRKIAGTYVMNNRGPDPGLTNAVNDALTKALGAAGIKPAGGGPAGPTP